MLKSVSAALVALALSTAAHATTFSGIGEGAWSASSIGSGTNSCRFNTIHGANTGVAWGNLGGCPDFSGSFQDSAIVLQDFSFSEELTGGEQSVQIGQFFWYNTVNFAARNFAPTATLSVTLTDPVSDTVTEALSFNIFNTGNPSSDVILGLTFEDYGLDLPVRIGSSGYAVESFSFDLLGDTTGEALLTFDRPNGTGLQWVNPENNISTVGIYANIAPVPLPAAGWMLIAGLGGLAAMRRRKTASA